MSFRLDRPRPRSPLPSTYTTPSPLSSPTTLLYDLPQPTSRSPPPHSPDTAHPAPLQSPTTPTSPTATSPTHTRQRPPHTPSPHARSATPTQVARQELDQFAALCHAWYFDQDLRAGQLMTQTIESLPASQRAPFSRLQASIRSAYHTALTRRRKSEFKAHLSSTHPGGSLSPSARAHPHGKAAKKERLERFSRFVRTWCTPGMPGTTPFFYGLWAVMRLEVLPVSLGGAGAMRIEWEFDDAVFQESADKEFMLEAIDVLKGVLGFEEYLPQRSRAGSDDWQPVALRPRSPSDPFLDTAAPLHETPSTSSTDEPSSMSPTHTYTPSRKEPLYAEGDSYDDEPYMRIWTTADLDNPELQSLISLFPVFIRRQTLPRFRTVKSQRRVPDLEEGVDISGEGKDDVSCGTGRMWVGAKDRRAGWKGSWWLRFAGWWRRLLFR